MTTLARALSKARPDRSGCRSRYFLFSWRKGQWLRRSGLYKPQYDLFAPHVGFDWNVGSDKKTVINGSASIIYDRTVVMAIQSIQDVDSYLFQQQKVIQNGVSTDPYDSVSTDPRLDSTNGFSNQPHLGAPATPKPPYAPFGTSSICTGLGLSIGTCGLQDGYVFNATIDSELQKTPDSMVDDFGVQRTCPLIWS